MKILVTGASGFVGRHLVADLMRAKHDVVLTGVTNETLHLDEFGSLPVCKMDITDSANCYEILNQFRPDAVIHLAGIAKTTDVNPEILASINIQGPETVVRALSQLPHGSSPRIFLFVSSAFVYGEGFNESLLVCNHSTSVSPRGDYGRSKLAAEQRVLKFEDRKHLKVFIARPFNHIGVGQDLSFVVPALVDRIRKAQPNSVIETGNMNALRDFTDVRDVVRAYRLIVEKQPLQQVVVIGSGQIVSIQKVFDMLVNFSGKKLSQTIAEHLKRVESSAALVADVKETESILGWRPEITLEQSLKDIWYAS